MLFHADMEAGWDFQLEDESEGTAIADPLASQFERFQDGLMKELTRERRAEVDRLRAIEPREREGGGAYR